MDKFSLEEENRYINPWSYLEDNDFLSRITKWSIPFPTYPKGVGLHNPLDYNFSLEFKKESLDKIFLFIEKEKERASNQLKKINSLPLNPKSYIEDPEGGFYFTNS